MSKAADLARTASASETALSNRNIIINGAMEIAQRSTSFSTSVTGGYHTVDRIKIGGSNNVGQWTSSQDTDVPPGFTKSFKMACTTADTSFGSTDHIGLMYTPEGNHMNSISKGTAGAKSTTLSFYMKSTVIKTICVEQADAGNARHVNFNVTPSAINTWERVVILIPADTSGGYNAGTTSKAAEINFWLGAGTNYTSGSLQPTWAARTGANIMVGASNWADSVGNTIWITGLQLEVGPVATPFEHRSYGQELALCQRYYQLSENAHAIGLSSSAIFIAQPLAVQMRAAPTIGQTGVFNCQNGSNINTSQSSTGLGTSYSTTREIYLHGVPNFSGLTAKEPYICPVPQNNSNRLTADAEL